jgi:hypothetical protein
MEGITGAPSEVSAYNIRSAATKAEFSRLRLADETNQFSTTQQKMALALKAGDAAIAKQQPGLIRQALPWLAGAYALTKADEEKQGPFQSQLGEIDQRLVREARLFNEQDPIRAPANPPIQFSQINPAFASFPTDKVRFTAHGGEMQNFPPRIGAIAGPGTEKSDDVPAMLSDGEFVMTAQAVRGAGNGSRRQGVKNLYDIMRNFEAVA